MAKVAEQPTLSNLEREHMPVFRCAHCAREGDFVGLVQYYIGGHGYVDYLECVGPARVECAKKAGLYR